MRPLHAERERERERKFVASGVKVEEERVEIGYLDTETWKPHLVDSV